MCAATDEPTAVPNERRVLTGNEPEIQTVLDSFPQYVLMIDSDHTIVMANKSLYETFGMQPSDVLGTYCPTTIHGLEAGCLYPGCPVEEAHATGLSVERELHDERSDTWKMSAAYVTDLQTIEAKPVYLHVVQDITEKKKADEALARLRSGLEDTVAARTQALESANRDLQREILERRRAEERIRQLAYFDTLTGLPNRTNFSDLLTKEIQSAGEHGQRLGVALLDLDGFKSVNDTMGHDAGDELLRLVGRRLEEATRAGDVAARMGGDEFLFVLTQIDQPHDVERIAQRLLDVFAEPFSVHGVKLQMAASVGGAVFPDDGTDEITLMKQADLAMYQAKRDGGNQFCRLPAGSPPAEAG